MSLSGDTEMIDLEKPGMWRHWCTTEKAVLYVQRGSPCNWCEVTEEIEQRDQGLYWCYPLKEYKRWPEYMEYYYWLDKKSS